MLKMESRRKYSMCRLCLSYGVVLVNIFEDEAEVGFQVKESLNDLLRVEVLTWKELPWVVCKRCIEKLKNFSDFKFKCLASNTAFIQRYAKTRHTGTTRRHRTQAKEQTMAVGEEPLCAIKVEEDSPDEAENGGIEDYPTTSALSVCAEKRKNLELDDTSEAVLRETAISQVNTMADISRDPVGDSDCSKHSIGESTNRTVYCESADHGNWSNNDVETKSSCESSQSRSTFVQFGGPFQVGRNSDMSNQSVDGADEAQSAWRVEKVFARSSPSVRGGRTHACVVCSKTFLWNSHLRDHMMTHTGEKPFQCAICLKSFTQESTLRTHFRTHTGEKPFACDECPKTFAEKSSLTKHRRVHTGGKPFSCVVCLKSFTRNSNLRQHMLTHAGD